MSSGKGPQFRRVRPAQTNRAALARWGFDRRPAIEFPETPEPVTTVVTEEPIEIPPASRTCPRDEPARECTCEWHEIEFDMKLARFVRGEAHPVPSHYRSTWHQELTYPPARPTKGNPNPLPRRERTLSRVVCYECRQALRAAERSRFFDEHGYYRLEDGPLDVKRHTPDEPEDDDCGLVETAPPLILIPQT